MVGANADAVLRIPAALDAAGIATLKMRIDGGYEALDAARHRGGPAAAARRVAAPHRFVATASSLSLGAVLAEFELAALLGVVLAGPVGPALRARIAGNILCDLDEAWVRRQYAPARYPPLHAPHGWHQDGGLGFAFGADDGEGDAAPLAMTTCWIALDACGVEAPGLEFVRQRQARLLSPAALPDEQLRRTFPAAAFWRPALDAGDALLFAGDILHRTQVSSRMTGDRTSIELRFFAADAVPHRLAAHRFVTAVM